MRLCLTKYFFFCLVGLLWLLAPYGLSQEELDPVDIATLQAIKTQKVVFERLFKASCQHGEAPVWTTTIERLGKKAWKQQDYLDVLSIYNAAIALLRPQLPRYQDRNALLQLTLNKLHVIQQQLQHLANKQIKVATEQQLAKLSIELLQKQKIKSSAGLVFKLHEILEHKSKMLQNYTTRRNKLERLVPRLRLTASERARLTALRQQLQQQEQIVPRDIYQLDKLLGRAWDLVGEGSKVRPPSPVLEPPAVRDNNNIYTSAVYKFRIAKPPYKSWRFSMVDDDDNGKLHLKIEHQDELAAVELWVDYKLGINLKTAAQHLRANTRITLKRYKLLKSRKTRFKGKAAYEDIFTAYYQKDSQIIGPLLCRRYLFKHCGHFFCLSYYVFKRYQYRFQKDLNQILHSFTLR